MSAAAIAAWSTSGIGSPRRGDGGSEKTAWKRYAAVLSSPAPT